MSIFEKNALVAVDQNVSRIDGFKFLNPKTFAFANLNRTWTRWFKVFLFLTETESLKSKDEKSEPELNR